MNNVKKLPNIIKHCMTIGEIPTSYKLSLTYEEQLLWFCKFLEEEVIPVVNNNSEVVEQLKNWFETLDVQDEINNKLDEMAESGELENIISAYLTLNGILSFNTVSDMVSSSSLVEGSTCRTLGNINFNDGYGSLYKIEKIISGVADGFNLISLNRDDLYARLIIENDFYIDVIKYGIKNDGTDVSVNLQNLINQFPNGATFFFANGTYNFKNIELKSNTTILGNTNTNFEIDDTIAKQFILDDVENIHFKNCNFKNGTDYEQELFGGAVSNVKASIYMDNSNTITIENCKFNINSGAAFIYAINGENVTVENCHFNGTNYAFILKISNCKNWLINNCIFENIYTTSIGNAYAIACGIQSYEEDDGHSDNITITNNIFKNHTKWETIDSHGGSNYLIDNNKFYNCVQPIAIFDDQRVNRVFDMENITITNNYFEYNYNFDTPNYSISVRGNVVTGKMCKHVKITNNHAKCKIFNTSIAIVNLSYCDDFYINNNLSFGIQFPALIVRYAINGSIENNVFEETRHAVGSSAHTRDILIHHTYNTIFRGNSNPSSMPPENAIDNNDGRVFLIDYEKNNLIFTSNNYFRSLANYYWCGKLGTLRIVNTTLYPNARATNKYLRNKALSNIVQFKTTTGSDIVETSANILDTTSIGEEVEIVGAGVNSGNLIARIIEYIDGSHVRLSSQAYATLNAAQVNSLDCTWVDLPTST